MKRKSLFTSRREGVIWILTAIVVLSIYSTLGTAMGFSRGLQERGLFESLFVVGFLMLVVAVATNGWQSRPYRGELIIAVGLAGVFLLLLARIATPEERTHLFEYSFVALLIHQGLKERRRNGRSVRRPALFALIATAALGWVDEGIQALLPNRVYDIRDVAFNAAAALFAVGADEMLTWVRRRIDGHLL